MNSPVVVILLDAFRHDYIDEAVTPFLADLSKKGTYVKRIIPSAGYCERSEIFSGKLPVESNYFTAIGYDPINSPFRKLKYVLHFIDLITRSRMDSLINNLARRLIGKLSKKLGLGMSAYRIPLRTLSNYRLTEDRYSQSDERSFGSSSIFNIASGIGGVYFGAFTSLRDKVSGNDESRLKLALENAGDERYCLYPVYISTSDSVGHKFGPDSDEMKKQACIIDQQLKEFIAEFKLKRKGAEFIIIGDHGMAPVKTKVDVAAEIKRIADECGCHEIDDYSYFLDSTFCRFWFKNAEIEKKMEGMLKVSSILTKSGEYIKKGDYLDKGIPDINRLYGDAIWAAGVGSLIWPDFFHNNVGSPPLGMHGYLDSESSLKGFAIITGEKNKHELVDERCLTDMYGLIKGKLNG